MQRFLTHGLSDLFPERSLVFFPKTAKFTEREGWELLLLPSPKKGQTVLFFPKPCLFEIILLRMS
jgi:hypothetical protein